MIIEPYVMALAEHFYVEEWCRKNLDTKEADWATEFDKNEDGTVFTFGELYVSEARKIVDVLNAAGFGIFEVGFE